MNKREEIPALLELTVGKAGSKQVNKQENIVLCRELKQGYVVRLGAFLDWGAPPRRWHLG